MIALGAFALAGCLAVGAGTDRITVRDLRAAIPAWNSVSPESPVGLAPAPGVQRIFHAPELQMLAARLSAPLPDVREVCIERPVAPLEPARILDAVHRSLPDAVIEILDYSRLPAPEGELEFPIGGLRQAPGGGFWSGAVRYAGNRRFTVWARVKVQVTTKRVIATVDLLHAHPVPGSSLRIETRQDFPTAGIFVSSVEEAAGRVLRRSVAAGTPLRSEWLDPLKDVARGQTVKVEVWNGGAHLELEAEAEASGSKGETIPVRNPTSKKRFLARVEGKGKVSVGSGGPSAK